MDTLNQIELQDIRHLCGASTGFCTKIEYYKTLITDKNALQILNKICNTCTNLKEDLCNKL